MPTPWDWNYLTAPPSETPIWGPFSIFLLLVFGIGLVGMVAVRYEVGGIVDRRRLHWDTAARAARWLIPIFAVGLLFFSFRVLEVETLGLSMRLWLYLTLLAALLVGLYYAHDYHRELNPEASWWPFPRARGDASPNYGLFAVALFGVYMLIAVVLYVWRGVYFQPDRWVILLFVTALLLGQWKTFLRDWLPVVCLLFGYEFMRGLAWQYIRTADRTIHLTELIAADRFMFGGHIPALWLQERFYVPGTVHWYDIGAVIIYAMHFVYPLAFAFLLWVGSKERFWNFTLGFLLMSYAGFAIYLLYPAAPPWLANDWGNIHGLVMPFDQTWQALAPQPLQHINQDLIWSKASGNPVAAMPSLHAAYPWITMLFAIKFFRWKGLLFAPYNLALWFTVMYLGHHWFIDVLAGITLASLCFVVVELSWPRIRALARRGAARIPDPAPKHWEQSGQG